MFPFFFKNYVYFQDFCGCKLDRHLQILTYLKSQPLCSKLHKFGGLWHKWWTMSIQGQQSPFAMTIASNDHEFTTWATSQQIVSHFSNKIGNIWDFLDVIN